MDDTFNAAVKSMTATVVRQVAPSRIERQLLVRVFELVCVRQCAMEERRTTTQAATGTQGDAESAMDSRSVGRDAA